MRITRPPMGWNSEKAFGTDINEKLIRQTADAMVSTGLRDAGYEYLVVDAGWMKEERDENGDIVVDGEKFPSGMKALGDYIHERGLKFGLYSVPRTVDGILIPSSYGHEFEDAALFASWGVDYVKYDCNTDNVRNIAHTIPRAALYNRMAMAIRATGREIFLAACNRGDEGVPSQVRASGVDSYRFAWGTSRDFKRFEKIARDYYENGDRSVPGYVSEIEYLCVGLDAFTQDQQLMQFAALCFFQSPLFVSCDLRGLTDEAKGILLNKDLIAFDQDEDMRPPILAGVSGDAYAFWRVLNDTDYALGFFNLGDVKTYVYCEFYRFGLLKRDGFALELTDVVTGQEYPDNNGGFTPGMFPYTCRVYRARLKPRSEK